MIAKYLCNYQFYHKFGLELTCWRQFHFLFITLYVSPASCWFMQLTTLVSVSLLLVSVSQDLVSILVSHSLVVVSVSLSYGLTNIPGVRLSRLFITI